MQLHFSSVSGKRSGRIKLKNNCVVFDIDGVLLKTNVIFKEILDKKLTGDAKWEYFYDNCNSDRVAVIEDMPKIIEGLLLKSCVPILSTARNEHNRESTIEKLKKEGIIFKELYMRKDNDYRPSAEVKKEHLLEISKRYNIKFFMDDDINNIKMAKELGIGAIQAPSCHSIGENDENTSNN